MPEPRRSDARRNYARILAVAEAEVAAHGAAASMEQIARTTGVGSATVRRHFPTRQALLEAVSRKRIDALCDRARDLADDGDGRAALLEWWGYVVDYCVSAKGLAAALSYDVADPVHGNSCASRLEQAAAPLMARAARDGALADDVTPVDVIALIVGIVSATESHRDPAAEAHRLFALAVAGLSPSGPR